MSRNASSRRLMDAAVKYLAAGGTLVTLKSNPDLAPVLKTMDRKDLLPHQSTSNTKRLIRYMRQQNLVSIHDLPKGKIRLRLATAGMRRAQKITLAEMTIPRPHKWDQRWRVVLFDIPEAKRQARNTLVGKLKNLGFYQLQKSIWIHPFPCLIEVEFIKRAYSVSGYVSLAEIDKIDRESQLTRHFRSLLSTVG